MNKNLSVRKLCTLGLLTAITVILAIFCTLRIGDTIKIPFKFISVFLTSAIFGPWWGGTVAALGDILNTLIVPVGAFNPFITCVEFLYGFIFGIFFYRHSQKGKGYLLRTVLCVIIMFLIDIFITSFILTCFGYFPSFTVAVAGRFLAGIIKASIHGIFIIVSQSYLNQFKKLTEK